VNNINRQPPESNEIITELFPDSVSGLILPIGDYLSHLKPNEFETIHKASDKRKFEFSTGRWCAKKILAGYGLGDITILSGKNREPNWPEGFVGSISHCKDLCGAVVANNKTIKSIGFDVETRKELKNDIARIVCTNSEKKWIRKQTFSTYNNLIILLFSLKESVYKCVYQNQKIKLSFKDVTIHPDFDNNTAQIEFIGKDIQARIELRFELTDTHIYSGAIYQ